MSLQARHLGSGGHTAAVLGYGYMPTFPTLVPFLHSIISDFLHIIGFYWKLGCFEDREC